MRKDVFMVCYDHVTAVALAQRMNSYTERRFSNIREVKSERNVVFVVHRI
jgi:hypothetical protein